MLEFQVARPGERALLCGSAASRRDFLHVGALAAVGLSLPQYARAAAEGKVRPGHEKRSCIMIFNLGGPSNMDLWDMKPDAPAEIRGPFKPIRTKTDAFELSELLPKHAEIADKFSLVRSCHHDGAAVHDAGWQMMQTGRRFTGGIQTPHAGSVASYLLGRRTDLPPFVVLPEIMGRGGGNLPNGQAGGFLGKAQDPFALMADPSRPNFRVPDLLPPDQISVARLDRRRKMREIVEGTAKQFEASEDARLLDENSRRHAARAYPPVGFFRDAAALPTFRSRAAGPGSTVTVPPAASILARAWALKRWAETLSGLESPPLPRIVMSCQMPLASPAERSVAGVTSAFAVKAASSCSTLTALTIRPWAL